MDPRGTAINRPRKPELEGENPSPPLWSSLSVLAVAMAAGFILARLEAGPKFDWLLLMTAMGLTAAVLMRVLADITAEREAAARYAGDPLKDILDSAGTMVLSIGLDGKLTYMNPTAERLLGYHCEELGQIKKAQKSCWRPARKTGWFPRFGGNTASASLWTVDRKAPL